MQIMLDRFPGEIDESLVRMLLRSNLKALQYNKPKITEAKSVYAEIVRSLRDLADRLTYNPESVGGLLIFTQTDEQPADISEMSLYGSSAFFTAVQQLTTPLFNNAMLDSYQNIKEIRDFLESRRRATELIVSLANSTKH